MKKTFIALALALSASAASAAPVTVSAVNGNASFPELIANDVFPAEGSAWDAMTNASWKGLGKVLTLTFNQLYLLEDVLLSVDNNDEYLVEVSQDNKSWAELFRVKSTYGEIGWGMDTMSSNASHAEYVAGIDFAPTLAAYARIRAVDGDKSYAVGELSFTASAYPELPANAAAVPEPGTLALLAGGLLIGGLRSRKRLG